MSDSAQDAPSALAKTAHAQLVKLDPKDEALHPLMRHALTWRHTLQPTPRRLFAGLTIPFQSTRFLLAHRALWGWAAAPALITLLLFIALLAALIPASRDALSAIWARPDVALWYDWLLLGLWYIARIAASGLAIGVSYTSSMMLGGVLASPFNDVLSEKTERLLLGPHYTPPPDSAMIPSAIRSLLSSAAMASMYLAAMIPILLLNLIPVMGSMASFAAGALVGGFFVALEYSDTLLERRLTPFRQKLRLVWQDRTFTLGFGVGSHLLLAIPLISFFGIPIAVIGGTAMGVALLDAPAREDADKNALTRA